MFLYVQYFSKHDTVKLSERNYLLWKHQILLILEGYEVDGFVLGTVTSPPFVLPGPNRQVVSNLLFFLHKKQDKFLASWLLSTVTDDVLMHLTMAKASFEIWTAIERRFGAKSTVKISSMRHALYSIEKENLSVKDYLAKVKSLSDSLVAAGSPVPEQEQVSIVLAMEYESIRILASTTPMSVDLLTELLLDCETRQLDSLTEVPPQANMVSHKKQSGIESSKHTESLGTYQQEYKPSYGGHGHGWSRTRGHTNGRGWSRSWPQCQLFGKIGHLV